MKVQIKNIKKSILRNPDGIAEAHSISTDPSSKYAVIEVFRNELYVAVKIEEYNRDILIGEYVDSYSRCNDIPMLLRFKVSWDCIQYGFCKLLLWAPENCVYEKTVARFYFDWNLYKKSYEAINGVPCTKKDPKDR
ncbi:MAG: hypothetical protein IJT41_09430 [Clostridia bacterium]|nr:hypothetical protein [Clostridia bacterium]